MLCKVTLALAPALLASSLLAQTPTISSGGVYNAASYIPSGLPSAAIAQGALFIVFGSNMGPASLVTAPSLPYTASLSGTSLTVTVNGTTVKPYMYYTSAGQIGAILPSNTPAGTGTITVTYNNATSATQPITVAASSVGIFTVNQAGSGPGIITTQKYAVNSLTSSASSGDVGIIWATGLGPVGSTGSEAAGTAPIASLPANFKVYVGGVSATIIAAARSAYPGLDQIAFYVPSGVTGCHVPVVVQTNNTVSNFVTMAIGTNGTCTDQTTSGLTPAQLTLLTQKGTLSIGSISLSRSTTASITAGPITLPGSTSDLASAGFERYTAAQLNASLGSSLSVNTFGACTVAYFTGSSATYVDPTLPTGLDAGSPINVVGSTTKSMTENPTGIYSATLGSSTSGGLFLNQGTYTITGPGGKDVGAISTNITLPPTLTWTNASSVSNIVRANGQLITWTGGDPSGTVNITGFSAGNVTGSNVSLAFFTCTAQDSAGQFTIPAPVLLSLPVTPAGGITAGGIGSLSVSAQSAAKTFSATGIDIGYIFASVSTSQNVTYQ